jgi:hypothetical protein
MLHLYLDLSSLSSFIMSRSSSCKHSPIIISDLTLRSFKSGFGGLVVCVLASGSRVRGFEPGRSRLIFSVCKKSTARLLSEGKSNNLSHVPTLGHVKDPFSHSALWAAKQNCLSSLLR